MLHRGTVIFNTKRLVLRPVKLTDAEGICNGFINQPGYLYFFHQEPSAPEQVRALIEEIREGYSAPEYYYWLILHKLSDRVLGFLTLRAEERNDTVEAAFAMDERYCDRGYMTEAVRSVMDYCQLVLQAHRFQGSCAAENSAAKRVLEKCGLQYEGMRREGMLLRDGYHDMLLYGRVFR